MTTQGSDAVRVGIAGGVLTIVGVAVSGPLGLAVVAAVAPQPGWQGARVYAEQFHPIQTLPFFGGFTLIAGCIMTICSIYRIAAENTKTRCLVAVVLTAAFSGLIFINYINQTTFVPDLARNYRPEFDPVISTLSLSNPHSLSWAIEMWGYALFGSATWLVAKEFHRTKLERATAATLIANGVLSTLGGLITAYQLSWVFTPAGLVSYAVWNLIVAVQSILVLLSLRRRATFATAPALRPTAGLATK